MPSTRSSSAAAAPAPENGRQSTRSSRKTPAPSTAVGEPDTSLPKQRGCGRRPKGTVAPEPLPESPQPESAAPAAPAVSKAPKAKKTGKKVLKTPASPSLLAPPQVSSKVTAKLQKERQIELADDIWVAIEANDAQEMTERSSRAVRHLSDIPEAGESAGEEVFNLTDISGGSSESGLGEREDHEAPVAPPRALSVNSDSALHIAALKAKIEELEALSRIKEKKPASGQKGTRKPSPSVASGLHPSYFQRTSKNATGIDTRRSTSPFEMGGLDDDDIADTCPMSNIATGASTLAKTQLSSLAKQGLKAKNLTRDTARKNDDVVIIQWEPPQRQAHAAAAPPQRQAHAAAAPPHSNRGPPLRRHETCIDLTLAPSHTPVNTRAPASTRTPASTRAPATRAPAITHAPASVNAPASTKPTSRKSKKALKQKSDNDEENSSGRLTANGVRTTDLPSFLEARNKWKAAFLPSLYHTFFLSMETFDAFKASSPEFHDTVQELIDLIYPESQYVLAEAGDPIVLTAYNRISILRSQIASHAITIIQTYLRKTFNLQDRQAPEYNKAHLWLLWARQLASGPLFFEVPTPFECRVSPEDPAFIFPNGRMRSPFLLAIVRNALTSADGSIKDRSSIPYGLFSISMAALERAACGLKEDATIDSKLMTNFCKVKWGEAIRNYCNSCCAVDADTLDSALALCQDIENPDYERLAEGQGDVRVVQRVNIFSFPSPTK